MKDNTTCPAHGALEGSMGRIDGKLTVVLLLLVTLIGGMIWNNMSFHTLDKEVSAYVAEHTKDRDECHDKMFHLEEDILRNERTADALASMCCGK